MRTFIWSNYTRKYNHPIVPMQWQKHRCIGAFRVGICDVWIRKSSMESFQHREVSYDRGSSFFSVYNQENLHLCTFIRAVCGMIWVSGKITGEQGGKEKKNEMKERRSFYTIENGFFLLYIRKSDINRIGKLWCE